MRNAPNLFEGIKLRDGRNQVNSVAALPVMIFKRFLILCGSTGKTLVYFNFSRLVSLPPPLAHQLQRPPILLLRNQFLISYCL